MPKRDQYRHKDPNKPWKWMSSGNGGYRMYYKGKEVPPDELEWFMNSNNYIVSLMITSLHKLLNNPKRG